MSTPFAEGSRVIVVPLGRKTGVVVGVGRGGHYRVQVGNTTVSCREEDLAEPPAQPKRRRDGRPQRQDRDESPPAADAVAPATVSIDLHGLTVEEAIARTVDAIDQALRRGADRLEVIHGKGSGRLRHAIHRHLDTMTVVASHRLDPVNPGVTWIYF